MLRSAVSPTITTKVNILRPFKLAVQVGSLTYLSSGHHSHHQCDRIMQVWTALLLALCRGMVDNSLRKDQSLYLKADQNQIVENDGGAPPVSSQRAQ